MALKLRTVSPIFRPWFVSSGGLPFKGQLVTTVSGCAFIRNVNFYSMDWKTCMKDKTAFHSVWGFNWYAFLPFLGVVNFVFTSVVRLIETKVSIGCKCRKPATCSYPIGGPLRFPCAKHKPHFIDQTAALLYAGPPNHRLLCFPWSFAKTSWAGN